MSNSKFHFHFRRKKSVQHHKQSKTTRAAIINTVAIRKVALNSFRIPRQHNKIVFRRMKQLILFVFITSFSKIADGQNSIETSEEVEEISITSTPVSTSTSTESFPTPIPMMPFPEVPNSIIERPTSTSPPPPNPFEDEENSPIDRKLDQLNIESQNLVETYLKNGRKLNGDLRRRLILYVMRFQPVQNIVEQNGDPVQLEKVDRIKYRFRNGLKIRYSQLKSNIDRLVAHLLAPIFAPFLLLQPDEIRPLYYSRQNIPAASKEPITVDSQPMSDRQSSFTALEVFPSSLPQDKWPQMDPRWLNQQVQFSQPSFTPFYQPFRSYYNQ
ncbi:unnamed protein product [Caenorhabditis angaria]|uniref:Uncharacterized protein n=1 Tax=Caenorhabditis angaria TaxID=860376 RepID=A0A9P1I9J8_9PELO|nr:unnamed protein product [Caenorhabditis angaria]